MKKLVLILTICGLCIAHADVSKQVLPAEAHVLSGQPVTKAPEHPSDRGVIAMVGDARSMLGPAGKNICVDANGADIAVMYGSPSDPYDAMFPFGYIYVAYSTDTGTIWPSYGPFNPVGPLRSIYPGVDGSPNFSTNPEELHFVWQQDNSGIYTFTWGSMDQSLLPNSEFFMMPCIGVDPEDPSTIMITANNLLNGANYVWESTNNGYTWGDTMRVTDSGTAGHFRWGSDDYAFFTYHDDYMSDEYPYYVESTDGGYTWSNPATLPAITSNLFYWTEFDCEVINDLPFAVHNDLDSVMQLFYPDPDDPGNPGTWNWIALNMDAVGSGAFAYQGTTWTTTIIQYPSIVFEHDLDVILVTYKAAFEITPPPPGWTDGNYLGGIVSTNQGRTWQPTRPLSGPLLQTAGGPIETAHRLATINDTTYCYSTWTDADYGVIGNQYFELRAVLPIDLDDWNPGVAENDNGINGSPVVDLTVFPTVVTNACRVSFNIPKPGEGTIKLFNATGRLVKTVYRGHLQNGQQRINITTSGLPNGIYMVVLKSENIQETVKIIKTR